MANKVIGDYTPAITIDGSTHYLLIQPGNSSTAYRSINRNVFLGVTGQPVDVSTSQNVTNKTLDNSNVLTIRDDRFTLQDNADTTKQAQFQLSGITTATTRTYTLPNASSTLADTSTAQTLTNKTLTAPVINNGSITGTTITTDAIVGQSASTSGTIYGLGISSGKVGSNGVVTASITTSSVTPEKLLSGTGTGWAWSSWTPTFTNWTIGTGGAAGTTAKYIQIGKTVFFRLVSVLGTTGSSVGSGVSFTLPNTPVTMGGSGTASITLGIAWYEHSGVGSNQGYAKTSPVTGSSTCSLTVINVGGTYAADTSITSSAPFAWAPGDSINVEGFYEAA